MAAREKKRAPAALAVTVLSNTKHGMLRLRDPPGVSLRFDLIFLNNLNTRTAVLKAQKMVSVVFLGFICFC